MTIKSTNRKTRTKPPRGSPKKTSASRISKSRSSPKKPKATSRRSPPIKPASPPRLDIERFRAEQRAAKGEAHAAARDVVIPPCADWRRRLELERDTPAWLRWYFPDLFWHEFTEDELAMSQAIETAAHWGTDQAIAGPRGSGKTTVAVATLVKCLAAGVLFFPVLFGANASKAEDELLGNFKAAFEQCDRFADDYPEICVPIRALEGIAQRSKGQTVSGTARAGHPDGEGQPYTRHRTRIVWSGRRATLPDVPGSSCAGAMIGCYGLDAAVRGVNVRGRRPDLALIDDADTTETADNAEQAEKLERKIDRNIAGLAGQGKRLARVMLCTIPSRRAVAFRFTDPQQKPSWNGKRYKLVSRLPDRQDLWDEYQALRVADQLAGDPHGRRAHAYYLAHRGEMDAGAEISNPYRFVAEKLPDGSQVEVSTLQFFYNEVARLGMEAVQTEYQNDPPEEAGPRESGLTAFRIQRQVSGFLRKRIPPGCTLLTQGIDCGKFLLHWVVRAWRLDDQDCLATGYTIDYGYHDVWGTTAGSDEGLDDALVRALMARKAAAQEAGYAREDGQVLDVGLTLVDAGWRTEAVYEACRQLGRDWRPAMGFGRSNGCVQTNFSCPVKSSPDKKVGDRWFLSRRPKGTWLVCMDADHWKSWEHDRWLSDPAKPGALTLWGTAGEGDRLSDDQRGHKAYANHLVNEREVEEVVKGVLKRAWKAKSDKSHFLDASYMSDVAASMQGVRLVRNAKPRLVAAGDWFK